MKKIKILLFVFGCLPIGGTAVAQTDPYAEKLLAEVAKKYDSYRTIRADFTFTAKLMDEDPYTDVGLLYLRRAENRYRISLPAQELISDGKTSWTVLKEDREVQASDAGNGAEDAIGPNNLFTFYRTGFKYVYIGDEREEANLLQVIELSPEDVRKNYFKIRLRINKNLHIHDVLIFDKSGARYTYAIKALYVNHRIPAAMFTFRESDYPGFEVVDLR